MVTFEPAEGVTVYVETVYATATVLAAVIFEIVQEAPTPTPPVAVHPFEMATEYPATAEAVMTGLLP